MVYVPTFKVTFTIKSTKRMDPIWAGYRLVVYPILFQGLIQEISSINGTAEQKNHSVQNSKKVTTHPWSTPQAIPLPNYERIPLQCAGKGLGVCSKGVLKQPSKNGQNAPPDLLHDPR